MKRQTNILEKIVNGHYTTMPTDIELASDLRGTIPAAVQTTLERAQDAVTALTEELERLPDKLETAKRRDNVTEYQQLQQRQTELPGLIYHAQIAAIDAEQAVLDTQLAPLIAANRAVAEWLPVLDAAIEKAALTKRIAEQRQYVLQSKSTVNESHKSRLEAQKAKLREARFH